jgi:hypothetical protein
VQENLVISDILYKSSIYGSMIQNIEGKRGFLLLIKWIFTDTLKIKIVHISGVLCVVLI